MKKGLTFLFVVFAIIHVRAQQKQDIVNYIQQYKDVAIEEMVRANIPASITLAQGILESGCGKSPLSREANNHFGIKCKTEWTGPKYYQDDDEKNECFRVYTNARESYADHSDFLTTRSRYAALFQLPIHDYKGWANGLKEAGYATNPKYPTILIGYIDSYQLSEYDKVGIAQIEKKKNEPKEEPKPEITQAPPVQTKKEEPAPSATIIFDNVIPKKEENVVTAAVREEFIVNGARAIKAISAEDPFSIAYTYNIDYAFILIFNDLEVGERFKKGENVFLQAKKSRGTDATYTVKAGESMRDIAQKTGVKLKELYAKNQMQLNDQPHANEVIYLQEKRTTSPKTMSYAEFLRAQRADTTVTGKAHDVRSSSTTHTSSAKFPTATIVKPAGEKPAKVITHHLSQYEVQKSDTLYSIAQKFNTTVEHIKQTNGLADNSLKPGQTLVIAR